jgi:hypothetical protein
MKTENKELIKTFLIVSGMVILLVLTVGAMQYVSKSSNDPYTFTVTDKYYMNSGFSAGYMVEDLKVPLTHSRMIEKREWDNMEIGKIYTCQNVPATLDRMFDSNPHHPWMTCEESI